MKIPLPDPDLRIQSPELSYPANSCHFSGLKIQSFHLLPFRKITTKRTEIKPRLRKPESKKR
jgi:hypothetical protein